MSITSYIPVALTTAQQLTPAEYVTSRCYGDNFNFGCAPHHRIRIVRDFYGYSDRGLCYARASDCRVANPRTSSVIRRFCTGRQVCAYYQVERRACRGAYTNYQQVEYQCIPGASSPLCELTIVKLNVHQCRKWYMAGHSLISLMKKYTSAKFAIIHVHVGIPFVVMVFLFNVHLYILHNTTPLNLFLPGSC